MFWVVSERNFLWIDSKSPSLYWWRFFFEKKNFHTFEAIWNILLTQRTSQKKNYPAKSDNLLYLFYCSKILEIPFHFKLFNKNWMKSYFRNEHAKRFKRVFSDQKRFLYYSLTNFCSINCSDAYFILICKIQRESPAIINTWKISIKTICTCIDSEKILQGILHESSVS